ncbi:hypothetical protein G6F65_021452 [Rhizopus arrhizus]|nr:hypothetical protein G6F65_021452 [Rhizopus arrhizus]
MTLGERLERNERHTGVRRVGELQRVQARERNGVGHAVGFLGDLGDLAQHFIGTRDRRAFRQLHTGDQVQLVLGRDEARRHQLEDHAGGRSGGSGRPSARRGPSAGARPGPATGSAS